MNRSLSRKVWERTAIIHRTIRWCTGLSGEPTVDCANGQQRDQRATRGLSQRLVGAPDCPVSQDDNCSNGQLSPIWKEIAHRTLSDAPPDSPVCQTEQSFGCIEPRLFAILFSLFLALRQNMLVLKNNSLSLKTHLVLVLHFISI